MEEQHGQSSCQQYPEGSAHAETHNAFVPFSGIGVGDGVEPADKEDDAREVDDVEGEADGVDEEVDEATTNSPPGWRIESRLARQASGRPAE